MGLELPGPGKGVFQARFSCWLQVTGNPRASLAPFPPRPRNWGHSVVFSAAARAPPTETTTANTIENHEARWRDGCGAIMLRSPKAFAKVRTSRARRGMKAECNDFVKQNRDTQRRARLRARIKKSNFGNAGLALNGDARFHARVGAGHGDRLGDRGGFLLAELLHEQGPGLALVAEDVEGLVEGLELVIDVGLDELAVSEVVEGGEAGAE